MEMKISMASVAAAAENCGIMFPEDWSEAKKKQEIYTLL